MLNFESIFEKSVDFESIFENFVVSKKMSMVDEVTISLNLDLTLPNSSSNSKIW